MSQKVVTISFIAHGHIREFTRKLAPFENITFSPSRIIWYVTVPLDQLSLLERVLWSVSQHLDVHKDFS